MKRRTMILTASAVLVGATGVIAAPTVVASDGGNAPDVVAVLAVEARSVDALPMGVDKDAHGLVETRYLGSDDYAGYWVGTDASNQICLIAVSPSNVSGSACNTPEVAERSGLLLGFNGNERLGEGAVVAHLLPDSAAATSIGAWTAIGDNLITAVQADVVDQDPVLIQREAGSTADWITIRG